MPEILILTPTLGDRPTLARAIESVQKIGKGRVRHIVIAPQNKIAELQAKFPGTEFMAERGRAKGLYPQLNDGFFKYGKEYDYLGWLNDDDYWLPDFEKLINAVEQNPELDFAYGNALAAKDNYTKFRRIATCGRFDLFFVLHLAGVPMLSQQSTLISSKRFFEIGGLSEKYKLVSDGKLWTDLCLLKPKFKYINADCAVYSLGENRLSSDDYLAKKEKKLLSGEYPKVSFLKRTFAKALFRTANVPLYIRRIFR